MFVCQLVIVQLQIIKYIVENERDVIVSRYTSFHDY